MSEVARKGFEKSTMDILLQVWVRSAAITSISLKIILMEEIIVISEISLKVIFDGNVDFCEFGKSFCK